MAAARMRESVISSTSSILMENPKKVFFFRAVDRKMLDTFVRAVLSWNADRNGGRTESVFKF